MVLIQVSFSRAEKEYLVLTFLGFASQSGYTPLLSFAVVILKC